MAQYSNDHRYLFMTGVIRACEAKMITAQDVDQLIRADSLNRLIELLRDTGYRDFLGKTDEAYTLEQALHLRRHWLFRFLEAHAPHKELSELLRRGYDYHNIKVLLKERILEQENAASLVDMGMIDTETLRDIFNNEDYEALPPVMRKGVFKAVDLYYTARRTILPDLVMDGTMFEELLEGAAKTQSRLIVEHFRMAIDLSNLQTAVRADKMEQDAAFRENLFVPGGDIALNTLWNVLDRGIEGVAAVADEYGLNRISRAAAEYPANPFAIEREADNTLLDHLRPTRFMIEGVEPVFAFGFAIEIELKIVGIIIACRQARMGPEWIRMRLPEPF